MTELVILAVAGVGTWAMRASFIATAGGWQVPAAAQRALGHSRHAVLAALVATALASRSAPGEFGVPPIELLAAAVAALVAWRTGGMLRTVAAGLAAFAALSLLPL